MTDTNRVSGQTPSPGIDWGILPPALTWGFGGVVAMWTIGYLLRLPGELVPGAVIAALLLLLHVGACAGAGRNGRANPVALGAVCGLVISSVNLLVLFSVISSEGGMGALALPALIWMAIGGAIGAIAGALGGRGRVASEIEPNWLFRFACVNVTGALVLILAGGLVTSAEAGLAVPNWPGTFEHGMFLFPLRRMTGGIYLEHAHRLLGAMVGLTTVLLMLMSLFMARSHLHRILSIVLFLWVSLQGVIGGVRVTETSVGLALAHGLTAQLFVAALTAYAALVSDAWRNGVVTSGTTGKMLGTTRLFAWLAFAGLVVQIGLGGAVRHFDLQMHALMTHIAWSLVVAVLLLIAGFRVIHQAGESKLLAHAGRATLYALGLQMVLGGFALWAAIVSKDARTENPDAAPPLADLLFTTAHQVIGAALLIASLQTALWATRTRPGGASASD
jgi:cytochrome c oxidase assembly protein subunit 15